ncbi:MAG: hypothetical protein RLZZ106_140 [Cyanobacteriota bacterium]|jgi:hypothetical protein
MNPTNITRAARLSRLKSHQRLNEVAAGACVADWPAPDSWAGEALQQGQWIWGDPSENARLDAAEETTQGWKVGPVTYGGNFRDYEVPYEENGRRCRLVGNTYAMATICDPADDEAEVW